MRRLILALIALTGCGTAGDRPDADGPPSPESFFGHRMGADRRIVRWPKIVEYFRRLEQESDRIEVVELGRSTLGKPFIMAVISAPGNLRKADRYREIAGTLFRGNVSGEKARELAREGKAIAYISCNLHSTEIGSSQMAPELAWRCIRGEVDLDDVVLLLLPSVNPDGQVMVSEWYDRHAGTKWEGGPMPWLYHPYAGHDNNRDFYFNNLAETRLVSDVYYRTWFPHVITDHHQMGSTSARMFVPPYDDPIAERIHPLVTRWNNLFGTAIALDMEERGLAGVTHQKIFSSYWMGGSQRTPFWQNRVGLLTETASCRIATPLDVDRSELSDRDPEVVTPGPWTGGDWTLRDIIDYQLECSFSILRTAGRHKDQILLDSWRMARDSIEFGRRHGAEVHVTGRDIGAMEELVRVLGHLGIECRYDDGGLHIPLDRPQSRMILELFSRQTYPPGDRPYDVVAWTLSWLLGLDHEIRKASCPDAGISPKKSEAELREFARSLKQYPIVNGLLREGKTAYRAADGRFLTGESGAAWKIRPVRLGLYKPWRPSIDEGWTRLVLERFAFPFHSIDNKRMREGKLREAFDCIILPDLSPELIETGRRKEEKGMPEVYPPEYRGGLGKEGVEALKKFVEEGGTLLCFNEACRLAIAQLGLPVRDVLEKDKEFSCPGSILRCRVDGGHFIGMGMPAEAKLFFAKSPVLQTSPPPRVDIDRKIVVRYDEDGDPLAGGYLNQPEKIRGRAALVEVTQGKGRVVLFAFRPQHRAQTWGTFKLLFNAILLSTAEPVEP